MSGIFFVLMAFSSEIARVRGNVIFASQLK